MIDYLLDYRVIFLQQQDILWIHPSKCLSEQQQNLQCLCMDHHQGLDSLAKYSTCYFGFQDQGQWKVEEETRDQQNSEEVK
jgi:hypothetical protein